MRLVAYQVSGCFRTLPQTIDAKMQQVKELKRHHFSVHSFFVLEGCNGENGTYMYDAIRTFPGPFYSRLINARDSILNYSAPKKEFHNEHPKYPYAKAALWSKVSVDKTLSMWHKMSLIHNLTTQTGHHYDMVWRSRPDYLSHNITWNALHATLRRNASFLMGAQTQFLVHNITDVEMLMSADVSRVYNSMWHAVSNMTTHFHPEHMLAQRLNDFKYKALILKDMSMTRIGKYGMQQNPY
jgi:hypothetical protein